VHSHQKCVVLIVEDEALQRLDAVSMVEDAGFDAVEAANADEAIRILEKRTDICVLFTDIDMPGTMDGLKLAKAVSERWPPVRLILTSGHVRVPSAELPAGGRFFSKPYRPDEIARNIREMIGA
jgi:DNA-binding NtrC family response regulator